MRGSHDCGTRSPQGLAFPHLCSTVEPPRGEGCDVRAGDLLDGTTAASEGTRAFEETKPGKVDVAAGTTSSTSLFVRWVANARNISLEYAAIAREDECRAGEGMPPRS